MESLYLSLLQSLQHYLQADLWDLWSTFTDQMPTCHTTNNIHAVHSMETSTSTSHPSVQITYACNTWRHIRLNLGQLSFLWKMNFTALKITLLSSKPTSTYNSLLLSYLRHCRLLSSHDNKQGADISFTVFMCVFVWLQISLPMINLA